MARYPPDQAGTGRCPRSPPRRPVAARPSLLWRNRDDDFPAWAGRDLTAQDPGARLVLLAVVATVYDPSDGSGDAGRLGLPPWPEVLELLADLNRVLRALAEDHQALVAEVHGRFLGHGLAAGDPTQPAPCPPDRGLWYCGLIEPKAWGASEIRASFWETLPADSG